MKLGTATAAPKGSLGCQANVKRFNERWDVRRPVTITGGYEALGERFGGVVVDWNELAIFVKVVQEGSFIEASRSLGVPRSTVSRKIASLEDRLGVRLLQRTTRSVRPTDEGRAYYERCAPLVREAAEAARAVGTRQDIPSGRLRLTAPSVLGHHFLGPIIAGFLKRWPEVRVELLLTDRIVNLVEEGYDLAIRVGKLPDSNLIAKRLGESQIRVVASPDYLEKHGEPAHIDALSDHACIVVGENAGPHHWTFAHKNGATAVPVSGPLVVNALDLARHAALEGLGVARLPAFLVTRDLAMGSLVKLLSDEPEGGAAVYAVYPSRRHLSATVRFFVDLLSEALGGDLAARKAAEVCAPVKGVAFVGGPDAEVRV